MIFAHGPLGALTSLPLRIWTKKLGIQSAIIQQWLLIVGFIGGIFPDIDLFYFHLFNAAKSHRELITHTPFFYITLFVIVGGILWWRKKRTAVIYVAAFCLGAMSHMVTDMIASQLRFLYPFSGALYGLSDFNNPIINANLFFINFLFEGIFFFFFFYALIVLYTKSFRQRMAFTIPLLTVFILGVGSLWQWNTHVYHGDNNLTWNDNDTDGVTNIYDTDLDGDGIENMDDEDADNDQRSNVQEIAENSEDFLPVWYDPTDGGLIQIPVRMGFLTNEEFPKRLYSTVGIFLDTEMQRDYQTNSEGYTVPPTDSSFDTTHENIKAWLSHRGALETGKPLKKGRNQIGDILFFNSGYAAIVTGFDNNGTPQVFDIQKGRPLQEHPVEEIVAFEGEVTARGKVFDSTTKR